MSQDQNQSKSAVPTTQSELPTQRDFDKLTPDSTAELVTDPDASKPLGPTPAQPKAE